MPRLSKSILTLAALSLHGGAARAEDPALPPILSAPVAVEPVAPPVEAPAPRRRRAAEAAPMVEAAPAEVPQIAPLAPTAPATIEAPWVISFGDDLGLPSDLTLQGERSRQRVDVSIPRDLRLTGDAVLRLELAHSAALLPERSHLTVEVNGQSVGSLPLDRQTQSGETVDVVIPQGLLRDYNNIDLHVVQHYTTECEDPADPSLWTRIGRGSSLRLAAEPLPMSGGLEDWPAPLLDLRGHGPIVLTPVLAAAPDDATIEALGLLAVSLGRAARYRGLDPQAAVTSPAAIEGVGLAVGLVGELPQLGALLPSLPSLSPGEGLIALAPHPEDPHRPILIVLGADAAGLRAAAAALAGQDRQPLLQGRLARVKSALPGPPPPALDAPIRFPEGATARFAELGLEAQTVRGRYAPSVVLPLHLGADAVLRPGGASLDLRYAYGAQLDPRRSTLELRIDGVTVRSIALSSAEGSALERVHIELPDALIQPSSRIELAFQLVPPSGGDCEERVVDSMLWGTIFDDSSLTLNRGAQVALPNLALLRHGLWPYRAEAVSPVTIGLPERPGPADWAAGFSLVATLARGSDAAEPALRLQRGTAGLVGGPGQLILLGSAAENPAVAALEARLHLLRKGEGLQLRDAAGAALAEATSGGRVDSIEQVVIAEGQSALILQGGDAEGSLRLAQDLSSPEARSALRGNIALRDEGGGLRTLDVATRQTWGSLPLWDRAQTEVRAQWWWLVAVLVVGAALAVHLARGLRQRAVA